MTAYTNTAEIIDARDLRDCLVTDIGQAASAVYLRTMDFDGRGDMEPVVKALCEAQSRGVETTVAYDPIARHYNGRRSFDQTVTTLGEAGVRLVTVGQPMRWYLPQAGRSHSKACLIDDISYYGGGVNLTGASFDRHDYMLRTENTDVSQTLRTVLHESESSLPQVDQTITLDAANTLLIDGGHRQTSIILDRAVELAEDATHAWYVSQFAPGRRLAEQLNIVGREALVKYNTPRSNEGVYGKFSSTVEAVFGSGVANAYRGSRKIHAKLLVVQHADGTRTALTGSHNLSDWGVRLGTKEIMFETRDQRLCDQLVGYAEDSVR